MTPFWRAWLREITAHRRTKAELRKEQTDHAITRAMLTATRAHLTLARDQADRALALAMASEWSPDDIAFLHELGVAG